GETINETYDILTESYGEIYNKYFTRTAPYFTNLEAYSNSRIKKMEKEISDLKARLQKLESKTSRK
ncbi:MAG: hypothetical protein JSW07_10500, partial [bacterium]